MKILVLFISIVLVLPMADAAPVDFVQEVRPIFQQHCYTCHSATEKKSGLRLDVKASALKGGRHHGPDIIPGDAKQSPLFHFITENNPKERMPREGAALSTGEIETISRWIDEGAKWPDGIDEVKQDHWSFKPLKISEPPEVKNAGWPRNVIDRYILAQLEHAELKPAPPADRTTWLRRVSLDLTGLPPTPEQMAEFLKDTSPDAFEWVVDDLLASPRYGERWAQHWLDVVRFADTHGFEVNTERPNAWPYRDYVIRAFNQDTPYDQFIREQIAGDATGADAATGFLVTASVLLPGQIGKDEPSKRLARQDALDEIVVNIGQSFLGLSVGCARCHDHRFDPISQKDYYAMQAFVAGVEYKDRPWRRPEAEARRKQADRLKARSTDIDIQLARFVPRAHVGSASRAPSNAKMNTESFAALGAKFVRFTIHNANLHPSLGLIEPCLDEFEIFTDENPPRNVALASFGTRVTASGSRASKNHQLKFVNDGQYGNSRSWISNQPGQGWVLFELPEKMRINRIVWGRDRTEKYQDRLATAYTLEAGLTPETMSTLTFVPPLRPSVQPDENTDRFAPVKARQIRFTILSTMVNNRREPCIDELEVFNTAGNNIALASAGAVSQASGSMTEANRHELRFLNDGNYGNSRSWMSHEKGKGWVILAFPQEQSIDRVVWGRDRQGKFKDRLAIEYRIDVCDASGTWSTVADSGDRKTFVENETQPVGFTTAGLSPEDAQKAKTLIEEKKQLQKKLSAQSKELLVFAGKFRKPDEIHLLRRGDPEQPQESVVPAVLPVLGSKQLAANTPEQERRKALAEWIASADHPLTARVMVNRIWQGHFGAGLVQTASDFGHNGTRPTHPELLDWLAGDFLRSGWSVKALHRRIVLSATYRQSSRFETIAAEKDATSRLLWRFPPRRLEGEAIRDGMLAVSGRLNLKMYGRGYNLFDKRGGLSGFKPIESFQGDGLRRMIYAHKVRRERDAVFGSFDCPDAGQSAARRRESTTPIQALSLFNSRFTLDESEAFANRVKQDAGEDPAKQIHLAYQLALNREPSAEEIQEAEPLVKTHGPAILCRALFNSNEFLFLP